MQDTKFSFEEVVNVAMKKGIVEVVHVVVRQTQENSHTISVLQKEIADLRQKIGENVSHSTS